MTRLDELDPELSQVIEDVLDQGIQKAPVPNADWYHARDDEAFEPRFTTLLEMWSAASHIADRGFTWIPEDAKAPAQNRSYREVYAAICRVAHAFIERGMKRGDMVLMVLPSGWDFLVTFFAVELAGGIPVPSYPPAMMERAEQALERMMHIALKVDARWTLTNNQLKPLLGELGLRLRRMREIISTETLVDASRFATTPMPTPPDLGIGPEDIAFLQFTSGSTGFPKGVVLSHANVCANLEAITHMNQVGPKDIGVTWLPLYHDMGLVGGLMSPVYAQYAAVVMAPTTFLLRPVRWLKAISDYRGTISAAPNFAFALCVRRVRPSERAGLDLSSWRLALNGAEPINLRTLVDFFRHFGPHGFRRSTMFPVYGLAESTLAVTYAPPGEPFKFCTVDRQALLEGKVVRKTGKGTLALVSVGKAVRGHECRVVDDEGRPAPERAVGNVVIRGPSVMRGYYDDPEATGKALHDGWLWTGDRGFVSNGGLYICGRKKDLIIVRGHNYHAEDLERVAERIDGVRGGGVVAFSIYDDEAATDKVVLVCEVRLDQAEHKAALVAVITEKVQQDCGLKVDDVVLVAPGTIPKTSSGKRQRDMCKQLYLNDALSIRRTSKLGVAKVVLQSGVGFLVHRLRRVLRR